MIETTTPNTEEHREETTPSVVETKPEGKRSQDPSQQNFIDEFDADDDLGEDPFNEEGAPVKTAEAKAPVQSDDAQDSDENLDDDDVQAPKPKETPDVKEPPKEAKPATPKDKTAEHEESAPPVVQKTPEEVQTQFREWRTQTEDVLAKHHYALNQEQLDELELNPGEFISKVASRVYLDAVTATMTQIVQSLPGMIEQYNQQNSVVSANETEFFGKWPELKEHSEAVGRLAKSYRAANPNADREQFINEVGAQAMVALRIPPPQIQQNNDKGNGKKTAPFVPASTTPPAGNAPPARKNSYDALASEWEEQIDDD